MRITVLIMSVFHLSIAMTSAQGRSAIQEDLDRTQSQLHKEILVKYHHSRKVLRTDPALAQVHLPFPSRVNQPLLSWRAELAVKGAKNYAVMTTTSDASIPFAKDENATTKLFDGTQGWALKGASPDARMMKGGFLKAHENVMLPEEDLYREVNGLESARQGIGVSFRWLDPATFSVAKAYEAGEYQTLGPEVVQGKQCVVLERAGLDKVWLDPSRRHALLKREWNWAKGEPLRVRITNSDFREVAQGLWLPFHSLIEYACKPGPSAGEICLTGDLAVDDLKVQVPDSIFIPEIPVGTVVWDYETNTSWYMPPANGKSFQKILDESRFHLRQDVSRPGVEPTNRMPRIIAIVVFNIVLIGTLLAVYLRHRRKQSLPNPGA